MRGHKGKSVAQVAEDISKRDEDTLWFIRTHIEQHHYPPSLRDIAEYLGVKSVQTAHRAVQRLVEQGLITVAPGIARSIAISETVMKQADVEEL